MTHENYKELLAAKALSALDVADARALNTHLESCSDCQSEMIELEDAAALLAFEAEPLEPTAYIRERILTSVRAEGRAQSDHVSPDVSQQEGNILAFERPRRNIWSSLGSFGALAAAVVFVAMIIALVLLWQKNQASQRELARLKEEMNQMQTQLASLRAMGELLTSPDAHMAKLTGTNVAPGAHAMLAYDKTGHAMLMAKGLPRAPEGMAYQLWYIKDNKKMPGKVFTPDAAGNGSLEDQIPAVARDSAVFAITLEPKGGVQAPTGSIYLVSSS
ncbi:MAG: anti-sigma factor domain-containing protein [Pyrinomonadaceae bacterium]